MKSHRPMLALIIAGLLVSYTLSASAQHLNGQITINVEKLLPEAREKLADFQSQLLRYVNEYDWSDNPGRYDIPVQIDIYFERADIVGLEDRYEARLVLSNQGDFQASDKRWSFTYQQGVLLNHTDQFHPLTSMLDFYFNILLGQEFDKQAKLGGTSYYQKAFAVAQLSKFTDYFNAGWKERSVYLERLQSEAQTPYRELEYFFNQARGKLRMDDRKTAGQYLRVVTLRLKEVSPESEGTARFFQLHHLDLARMLSALGMAPELQEISRLDPTHTATYEDFIRQMQQ